MRLMLVRLFRIVILSPAEAEGFSLARRLLKVSWRSPFTGAIAFTWDDSDATLLHVSKIWGRHLGVYSLLLCDHRHRTDRSHYRQAFCNPITGAWPARHGLHECSGRNASWT